MNVAFDISALGIGFRHESGRSGIHRVVERLAQELIGTGECDLTFVAGASFEVLRDSLAYRDAHAEFLAVPMIRPAFLDVQVRLERALRTANGPGAARAVLKETAWTGRAFLGGRRGPADWKALSSADVFHSPAFPLVPCGPKTQRVLTCHDLIPIRHPEYVEPGHRQFAGEILQSVKASDWLVCISEAARDDICEYLGFDRQRTFVIYLAADSRLFRKESDASRIAETRKRHGIPDGPYLLSLATLEPRRNLEHLVRCFSRLVEQERLPDVSLVLVGHRAWGVGDLLQRTEEDATTRGNVVVTGYVPDEDLAPLYSGATAFVYPSLAEGFGLTPLEAMQCGAPVITSNVDSLPEVVGDAAIQVDPSDADALAGAMLDVLRDLPLRTRMSQRSQERAAHFSWQRAAQETIRAYRLVADGGR